jgi:all-trans-8'-apo-beta-carotenal 15,15'-oxygenase
VTKKAPSCSLNGIGLFEQFGKRFKHTFEGDGAISAIKLENSKAPWSSRFLNGLKNKRKNTAKPRWLF